jgi:hypothetical protein
MSLAEILSYDPELTVVLIVVLMLMSFMVGLKIR